MSASGESDVEIRAAQEAAVRAQLIEWGVKDTHELTAYVEGTRVMKTPDGSFAVLHIRPGEATDADQIREWYNTESEAPYYDDPTWKMWWPAKVESPDEGCRFIKIVDATGTIKGISYFQENLVDGLDDQPTTLLRGLRVAPDCNRTIVDEPLYKGVGTSLVVATIIESIKAGTSGLGVNSTRKPIPEAFYERVLGPGSNKGKVYDERLYFVCKGDSRAAVVIKDFGRFVQGQPRRPMVIDTDPGVDDAQAIILALSRPDVKVVGITTVAGNVGLDQVVTNVGRLLEFLDPAHRCIPFYRGSDRPLVGDPVDASYFHGSDGFGDRPDVIPATTGLEAKTEHGVAALLRLSKEYAGTLEVVALGPLTNIALAIRLDADFVNRVSRIVIMGGSSDVQGNTTATAEFNFFCDPEAAAIVINAFDVDKLLLVPWETTLRNSIPWELYDEMREAETRPARFLKAAAALSADFCKNLGWNWVSCDPIAMAVALNPETVIKELNPCFGVVELQGTHTRGALLIDKRPSGFAGAQRPANNITVVTDVNVEEFLKMVRTALVEDNPMASVHAPPAPVAGE